MHRGERDHLRKQREHSAKTPKRSVCDSQMEASKLSAYLTAGALRQAGSHAGEFCLRRTRTVCGHEQPGLGRMSVTATVMSSVSFAPDWKQAWNTHCQPWLSQLGSQQGNLGSVSSQAGSAIN